MNIQDYNYMDIYKLNNSNKLFKKSYFILQIYEVVFVTYYLLFLCDFVFIYKGHQI